MSKTGDGYSANTHRWGQGRTGGSREKLDPVDKERDLRVGWKKGGRLKIKDDTQEDAQSGHSDD